MRRVDAFGLVVLALALVGVTVSNETEEKGEKLIVHIVAHTHDDVGWLKTVDEYYTGANYSLAASSGVTYAGVWSIIETMVDALADDPAKRYTYVETAFFERWWNEQNDRKKAVVRRLVKSGQLEFVGGGWCMNDEATVQHEGIISQMTRGHEFLRREFGIVPRVGWQIDPFGHSSGQARLFKDMGMDSFFVARIDYQDREKRIAEKDLEFVWRGSPSLGAASDIWFSVMINHYCWPAMLNWEGGDAEPVVDDRAIFGYNVKRLSDQFRGVVQQYTVASRHRHVFIPFGCDFSHANAKLNMINMDKIIRYINAHEDEYNMHVMYSTPYTYTKMVNAEKLKWTVKTDDFFPYADGPHAYWTGFFTSRPALKTALRSGVQHVRAADMYTALHALGHAGKAARANAAEALANLEAARARVGVVTHHDGVTGTEKQAVADDYALRLDMGLGDVAQALRASVAAASGADAALELCPLRNVSVCAATEHLDAVDAEIHAAIFNPVSLPRDAFVDIPVPHADLRVVELGGDGVRELPVQITANNAEREALVDAAGAMNYTLTVQAPLEALGVRLVTLQRAGSGTARRAATVERAAVPAEGVVLRNGLVAVAFSGTGELQHITDEHSGTTTALTAEFFYYIASEGDEEDSQASGAYIFRPQNASLYRFGGAPVRAEVVRGDLFSEVTVSYAGGLETAVRLYKDRPSVRFEYTVGPVDMSDYVGKEVICKLKTDLASDKRLYTDSNGLEWLERIRDERPTWKLNVTEPVSSNYYPMSAFAFLRDEHTNRQFTVLNDRAQGVASLADGEMEIMVHRRLLCDDGRGVGEALDEAGQPDSGRATEGLVTAGVFELVVAAQPDAMRFLRFGLQEFSAPELVAFSQDAAALQRSLGSGSARSLVRAGALPSNVVLHSFTPEAEDEALIRFQHIFAKGEDPVFSKPETINLHKVFADIEIVSAVETTITGNTELATLKRLHWITDDANGTHARPADTSSIELTPMQIRTFRCKVRRTA